MSFLRNKFIDYIKLKNFCIELFFRKMSLQVFSPIYNISQLSSRWVSVVLQYTNDTKANIFRIGSLFSKKDYKIVI